MTPDPVPRERPSPAERASPHHRVHLIGLDGKPGAQLALPLAFSSPVRSDLIQRAVVAAQSHRRQPYGTTPTAGLRHSVEWSGKGRGVARTPRLMDSMTGAQAPNTVGGRPAHPPSVDRIWSKKINRKEQRLAFTSALAATRDPKMVAGRGHSVPHTLHLPVVVEDPVEQIQRTQDAQLLLEKLKLWDDVERARSGTHLTSSGRARRRGRVRRTPRSILVVTSGPGKALGFRNLAGVDVVPARHLATEDLAPGGAAGRLTVFSRAAVESLRERLGEAAA